MSKPTPAEIRARALKILKEEIRARLESFSGTLAGQIVNRAGKEVAAARKEGRELDLTDLASFCLNIPDLLTTEETNDKR